MGLNGELETLLAEMQTQRDAAVQELTAHKTLVAEIAALVPGNDPVAAVRTMAAENVDLKKRVLEAEIKGLVQAMVPLTALRPMVAEMMGPVASKEEAITKITEIMGAEHMKQVALALAKEIGGPRVVVSGFGERSVRREPTQEEKEAARARLGL